MDSVVVNARVITSDPMRSEAEALAIRDRRIKAIGPRSSVSQLMPPDTPIIDLGGRTVVPGFIDTHSHFSITTFDPVGVDCSTPPNESLADIYERIRAAAAEAAPGQLIRGFGYNDLLLREHRHPTLGELDEVCPDRPLVLVHWSLHRVVANTRALELAGISRETPDPDGGTIVRDSNGAPTGLLYERAMDPLLAVSLNAWLERYGDQVPDLVAWNARRMLSYGITGVHDVCTHPQLAAIYRQMAESGSLPIHLSLYGGPAEGIFRQPWEYLDRIAATDPKPAGRLKERGLKIFLDGAFSRVAVQIDWPDGRCRTSGLLFWPDADLRAVLERAADLDVQVTGHAVGNRAIDQFLNAIGDVQRSRRSSDPRYRIEHYELVTDDLLDRTRDLGVMVSSQSMLIHDSADLTLSLKLPETMRLAPYRTIIERGINLSSSSDFPCMTVNPLDWIWGMVARRTMAGEIVEPDERLDVLTAIRLSTLNAANAGFAESDQGSLAEGKLANFAVLSADPRDVPVDAIRDIVVEETYLEGESVFQRGEAANGS